MKETIASTIIENDHVLPEKIIISYGVADNDNSKPRELNGTKNAHAADLKLNGEEKFGCDSGIISCSTSEITVSSLGNDAVRSHNLTPAENGVIFLKYLHIDFV